MSECFCCPRKCAVDRSKSVGVCSVGEKFKVAKHQLHMWEEPCISGKAGSGTIFFSGCSLKCVFCQNYEISHLGKGVYVEDDELVQMACELAQMGAQNINLVTGTHYAIRLAHILPKIKEKTGLCIIYNCSGYESVDSLRTISDCVDVYLPDIKYFSSELSAKYSGAGDYFKVASAALEYMFESKGYPTFSDDGKILSGVLVRHMVLPSHRHDSFKIIDYLADNFDTQKLYLSLLSQYFPEYKSELFPEINRKLTTFEYTSVVKYAKERGITNGYMQEISSANKSYVPKF